MVKKKPSKWFSPDKEGRSRGRLSKRFCQRCGTTIQHAPILKSLNLCSFCVEELRKARDGVWSCKGCGALVPDQLRANNGYCSACLCPACGRPAPAEVRQKGMCSRCLKASGVFCVRCGTEASAQVKKNKGICDRCASQGAAQANPPPKAAQSKKAAQPKKTSRPQKPGRRMI
ncbi:MAG TPA: hypothetical protein DCY85_12325 [Firmicutes bacterium]|jgi:NMD protein affecting ribosome stability and mRNA decay|nr:hypothetical protein [Bacillota bacterium]HBE07258.1 hypothetical protein [Bacillota bacterium]HBG44879.1 hypothetical protein [Bacillota bacterium]HBL68623.1 hypothetical protein [Bacillota bacterium]HBR23065.1 hypothetical protein [Bacillota bacterium]